MGRYTLASKISEDHNIIVYAVSSHADRIDCYIVFDLTHKNIKAYYDAHFKNLIFNYHDMLKNPDYIAPDWSPFARILSKLIAAIEKGEFPPTIARMS